MARIRRHAETIVVAFVTAAVTAGAPAAAHFTKKLTHLVKHLNPLFVNVGEKASDSDLLDGRDASEFLGVAAKASDADLLDGMDSADFLPVNGTAANAEQLDGLDSSAFQPAYSRTMVVDTAGELLQAVSTATPSTLIKLEPGTYNIGSNVIEMPSGVDIEGSGEGRTTIARGGFVDDTQATVIGTNNTELRFLSVTSSGGANAIALQAPAGFRLVHVSALVQNGTTLNVGVDLVGGGGTSLAVLSNVNATALGAIGAPSYGIRAARSAWVRQSTVNGFDLSFAAGTGIVVNAGAALDVEGSLLVGGTDAITQTAGVVRVAATRLVGGVSGTATCAGVWDSSFTFSSSSCPA